MPAEMPTGGLPSVVRGNDYRASLEALRDRLAAGIDEADGRQLVHLAPLAKQLSDVLATLAAMPTPDAVADSVESAEAEVADILRLVQ